MADGYFEWILGADDIGLYFSGHRLVPVSLDGAGYGRVLTWCSAAALSLLLALLQSSKYRTEIFPVRQSADSEEMPVDNAQSNKIAESQSLLAKR